MLKLLACVALAVCVGGGPFARSGGGGGSAPTPRSDALPPYPGAKMLGNYPGLPGPNEEPCVVDTLVIGGAGTDYEECVNAASGAEPNRLVVFNVCGVIDLDGVNDVNDPGFIIMDTPGLFIAGETACAGGIHFVNGYLRIEASDIVLSHVAVRTTNDACDGAFCPSSADGIRIGTSAGNKCTHSRIYLQNISVAFTLDESFDVSVKGCDVTLHRSIVAWPLQTPPHSDGPHAFGVLVDEAKNVLLSENIFAFFAARAPKISGEHGQAVVGNVIYGCVDSCQNWDDLSARISGTSYRNDFRSSSETAAASFLRLNSLNLTGTFMHAKENAFDGVVTDGASGGFDVTSPAILVDPARKGSVSGLNARPANEALAHLKRVAGSRPTERDDVDTQVIAHIEAGTGTVIDDDSEVTWSSPANSSHTWDDPGAGMGTSGYSLRLEAIHALNRGFIRP